jgi:tetratricopeptide (TPR) repeat protein
LFSNALALSWLVVSALVMHVQAATPERPSYAQALAMYVAGEYDAAVNALRDLSLAQIHRERAPILRRAARGDARTLRAMLALETESKMPSTAIDCARRSVTVDLRARTYTGPLSGTLYDLVLNAPGNDPFVRAHALLVISYDQGLGAWREALSCYHRAPAPIRQAPEMLLALGAIHETAWRIEHEDDGEIDELRPNLGDAEAALRDAVGQAPGLEEASLRLAHVLLLRERDEEAARILRSGVIRETGFTYLARLFEGSILERAAAFDEAAARYDAAAALMPDGQSAKIARAHLAFRRGHRDEAAAQVGALASETPPTEIADPWVWYTKGTAWRASNYLDEMRRLVRAAPTK